MGIVILLGLYKMTISLHFLLIVSCIIFNNLKGCKKHTYINNYLDYPVNSSALYNGCDGRHVYNCQPGYECVHEPIIDCGCLLVGVSGRYSFPNGTTVTCDDYWASLAHSTELFMLIITRIAQTVSFRVMPL